MRLAQHARRLAPDTRLTAWLYTVAHHRVVSWARAQGVRSHLAGSLSDRGAAADGSAAADERGSPLEALASSEAQRALERAFAALAPPYREVALLVGVDGLTPREIAAILGLKPDAVRQRLARARGLLAAALGDHAPAAWRVQ